MDLLQSDARESAPVGDRPGRDKKSKDPRIAYARRLAALLSITATALFVAGLPKYFERFRALEHIGSSEFREIARSNLAALGLTTDIYAAYHVLLSLLFALVCLVPALLLFRRRGGEFMALFVAALLALIGAGFANPAAAWETATPAIQRLQSLIGALSLGGILLFFFVFPNGQFAPRWIRVPVLATTSYLALIAAVAPQSTLDPGNWPPAAYALFLFFWIALGLGSQAYRYRRLSRPQERQQTRLVIFGFALALSISTGVVAFQVLVPTVEPGTAAELAATTVALGGMLFIPLSIAAAIYRYRLFDIDLVIRQTLVFSLLTALLAAIFYLTVILVQNLFSAVLRIDAPRQLVTVLSTLLIAALFTPLRRRVQAAIDRRFYRPKYDARQALANFSQHARDEVDLEALAAHLLQTIEQAVRPAHTRLWLREAGAWRAKEWDTKRN